MEPTSQLEARALLVRRGVARAVDLLVQLVLVSIVFGLFRREDDGDRTVIPLAALAVVVVGLLLYETLSVRATGATPGKVALRLRVTMLDGGPVTTLAAVLRALPPVAAFVLCLLVRPLQPLMPAVVGLVYGTAFASPAGRGVTDGLAGTVVRSR